jgi:hypothetical protein
MAKEKIWITWLPSGDGAPSPSAVVTALQKYGYPTGGAEWIDNVAQLAWSNTGLTLLDPSAADLWLIAGRRSDWERPTIRHGLAMVAAMVAGQRGSTFPIVAVGLDFLPNADHLPTPLASALCLNASQPAWGIKIGPGLKRFTTLPPPEYRVAITAEPHIGLWIEVGPRDETWNGVMFGVSGAATITHQAVGPKEELPSRTVLEYPIKDMKLTAGDHEYTACAVGNHIDPETSYYVKIDGQPDRLLFGGHPGTDDAEVFVLTLV